MRSLRLRVGKDESQRDTFRALGDFHVNRLEWACIRDENFIAKCREWLEEAIAKARTDKQRARGELLLKAFEYYEASALAYPRPEDTEEALETEAEALARLEDSVDPAAYAQKRLSLAREFEDHPVLIHPLQPTRYSTTTRAVCMSWSAGG
ncbi:MAG: hypothetical protein ACQESR_02890 [Planctomycetota bacterium]